MIESITIHSGHIQTLLKNKKAKQILALYTSMAFGLILGLAVSIINTRLLGPQHYGDLKFLQNLFSLFATLITFGIFVSGARLLAQHENQPQRRQIIGSLLLMAAILSLLLITCIFPFSYFQETIFENSLGHLIRSLSPLLFVFLFKICLESALKGDNKIYELSMFRTLPALIYLAAAIAFNFFIPLSLNSALAINLLGSALVIIIISIIMKPKFDNIRNTLNTIWQETTVYGFQVYIGTLCNVATVHLASLIISFFVDNLNVGYFALAMIISDPLRFIPVSIGTTFFKDFANKNRIPRHITFTTILLSIFGLLLFLVFIDKVVLLVYSETYIRCVPLAYLISFGNLFKGIGGYFNNFILAHGGGKFARNAAVVQGISNIIGFSILVYIFGVTGAALTLFISGGLYCFTIFHYYNKITKDRV